jgi:hypothetical protein
MSLTQTAAPDGQSATWSLNGSPVVSTGPGGLQFQKNKLINGEVTRINQRAFNGTWSGKSVWETQPATIAGKEAAYGYDMWFRSNAARSDGTGANENMAQWIEAGNYRPSTVHTLSGTGVTTTNITSPASGDWKIVVAQGATNVQLEEGAVATPFEIRSIRYELAECQRYYEKSYRMSVAPGSASATLSDQKCFAVVPASIANSYAYGRIDFQVTKRVAPSVATYSTDGTQSCANNDAGSRFSGGSAATNNIGETGFQVQNSQGTAITTTYGTIYTAYAASAVI